MLTNRFLWIVLFVIFFKDFLFAQTSPPQGLRQQTPSLIAFTNATIISSPGQQIENATLLIQEGKIVALGKQVTIPPEATIRDVTGLFIYPGFIDPYSDYGVEKTNKPDSRDWRGSREPKYEGTRIGGNAWNDALHAEKKWFEQFKPEPSPLKEWYSQGVTAVQSAKLDGILRGRAFVTLLEDAPPNEVLLNPNACHFASFQKGSSPQSYPSSLMGSIALLRQTFLDTEWYRNAQRAYRMNSHQKKPEFNAALQALEGTLPENNYSAHYPQEVILFESGHVLNIFRAARIAQEFQLKMVYIGSHYEYTQIESLKSLQTTIILPLDYPKTPAIDTLEGAVDVSLEELRHFERAPSNPAVLEQHQIPFAFTAYHLKNKSDFLKNIRKAITFGLSKEKALAALTTVPATIGNVSTQIGTLEPGKLANFILCSGDIFEESSKIYSVWIQGHPQEVLPYSPLDPRGTYPLTLEEREYFLEITGNSREEKLQAKLIWTEWTPPSTENEKEKIEQKETKVELVSFKSEKIQGFFSLKNGTFRFTARVLPLQLQGEIQTPEGKVLSLQTTQKKPFSTKENKKEPTSQTFLSNRTFPNKAFGFSQLPKTEDILIRNATVWTCSKSGVLLNTDIFVQQGKIAQIGANLKTPEGIRILDAKGKHVTPGIIDEHSHIAISFGINEAGQAISAEVRIGDVVNSEDINIYRALAGGVTLVQILHGSANPIGGQAQMIKLRWGSTPEEMKVVDAPASIKFALGENVKQSNWGEQFNKRYPQSRMGVESLMKDAFWAAQQYQQDWNQYLSLSPERRQSTVPPRKDLELEALWDILQSKMFVHCHSYVQSEILMLMRLAEEFGFKIQTFTHILEGYKVAEEMAKHGTSASTFSDWWAYKFEVYDAIPHNAALMTQKKVLTSINSDSAEMGRRLNQEASKAVLYGGLSPEEALHLITINPAIQLKIEHRTGSLEVGKDADFVLWSAEPLSIYARVEQTWIDGKCYFDQKRDRQMSLAQQEEKNKLIQKFLNQPKEKEASKEPEKKQDKLWHCEDIEDVWNTR